MKKLMILAGLFVSVVYGDYASITSGKDVNFFQTEKNPGQRKKWKQYHWKRPGGMGMKGGNKK